MASSISGEFERIMAEAMKEIDKKMEKAFQNTMKRMETELAQVMEKATVQNYYKGYSPHVYQRTNQLYKAISLEVEDDSYGNSFSFQVIPIYDESDMDHSEYDIIATYKHKKNKKPTGKVSMYKCHVKLKNKPNEEEIMETTLGSGWHPRVGTVRTIAPIWEADDDGEDDGYLFEQLEDYIQKNTKRIFNEEYDKL